MAVFLRRVLPLECLLSSPCAAPAATLPEVVSISSETDEGSPCPMDDMSDAEDEPEAQVNDWRFSELRTKTGGLSFVVAPLAICHGLPWTGPAWMF